MATVYQRQQWCALFEPNMVGSNDESSFPRHPVKQSDRTHYCQLHLLSPEMISVSGGNASPPKWTRRRLKAKRWKFSLENTSLFLAAVQNSRKTP